MATVDSTSQPGTQPQPNGEGSTEGSGQQSSFVTKEQYDALLSRLDKFERTAQGDKDRAVKRTNERLNELEAQVKPILERAATLIKGGADPTEALSQAQTEQEEAELKEDMRTFFKTGTLPSQPAGSGAGKGVDVISVIGDYGLDMNNPEVKLAFEGKQFSSLEEAELTAARLLKPKPSPTAAQTPAKPVPSTPDVDSNDLISEYDNLTKHPSQNLNRMKEIEGKLREMKVW